MPTPAAAAALPQDAQQVLQLAAQSMFDIFAETALGMMVVDREWVAQVLAEGRGLILLTPHLGSFEVAGRSASERFGAPLTALYRPSRQAWLRDLEAKARARPGLATAPASLAGVRQMLRALQRGEIVGLLPDQVPPQGQGVWAPFFGQPAYTMTLATRLARQTGAAVGLVWCERLPKGRGFVAHAEALPGPWPDDEVAAATLINQAMERAVRALPGQYLWGYHRYKSPRRQAATAPAAATVSPEGKR